jgi:hypothetical protein
MIVASETSPNVSVSVSTPAGKLRSVIGHRNINRPIESSPIRLARDACIRSAPTKQTRRRRIGSNIAVSELQGYAPSPVRDGRLPPFVFARLPIGRKDHRRDALIELGV